MEQSRKLTYLICFLAIILLSIIVAYFFSSKKIVSPVPENSIKVIFETPQATSSPTNK